MSDGAARGGGVSREAGATALVEATEQISGVTGALVPVSNTDCDRGPLEERVAEAVDGQPVGGVRRPRLAAPASSRC